MPDRRYWDAVHEAWRAEGPQELWRQHSDAVDMAWLKAWLPAGRVPRLLKTDLFNEGISPGLYPMLASAADQVFGVDISAGTTAAARERYPALRTATADVRRLPFADGSFDVIVSNSTLDHFHAAADIAGSLVELQRVLRTGGYLLVSLDNPVNPFVGMRNVLPQRMLQRLGIVPYYVGATYGPGRLRRILRESGFDVESATATLHCPRVFAVPVGGAVERFGREALQKFYLRALRLFEGLSRLPTRYLTGHFIVAKARKRDG